MRTREQSWILENIIGMDSIIYQVIIHWQNFKFKPPKSGVLVLSVMMNADYSHPKINMFVFVKGGVNECLNNNGGCSQVCNDIYNCYYCSCRVGYRILNRAYSCPRKKFAPNGLNPLHFDTLRDTKCIVFLVTRIASNRHLS